MPEDSTPAAPETAANDASVNASDAADHAGNETSGAADHAAIEVNYPANEAPTTTNDAATDAANNANDGANGVANEAPDNATTDVTTNADNETDDETDDEATNVAEPTRRSIAVPRRVVFRVPGTAYIAVLFFVMCASSTALVSRWFTLIYLIPLGIAVWIMRTRTEVDAERIVVRRVLSRTTVPWSAVKSLRLSERGWVRAVRTDGGGEIALPTVRTRHLPALALISGGRIADPTVAAEQANQQSVSSPTAEPTVPADQAD